MNKKIQKLLKLYWRLIKLPLYKKKVLNYYHNNPESQRYSQELAYLKNHKVSNLLGGYLEKYRDQKVDIKSDSESGLHYILHKGNRLYFKRNISKNDIRIVYKTLLCEQDEKSAHCYQGPGFCIEPGDIMFDIGAAEGIIGLSVVEKLGKLYLFEYDEKWVEALTLTFAPWKEKVVIVPKYVSDTDGVNTTTLDSFCNGIDTKPGFIKMDIEGFEQRALNGMRQLLDGSSPLKIAICTYHNFNDAEAFERFLVSRNFKVSFSNGYMLYHTNTKTVKPPYFVHGLIRAQKNGQN